MGWCSGTTIFDKVVEYILESKDIDKKELIRVLVNALFAQDWDCEGDSKYWKHPLVREVFAEMYPDWFKEEEG